MANDIYQFTPQVQKTILAIMWRDFSSYTFYKSLVKPKYFQDAIHVDICRELFDYNDTYGHAPTAEELDEVIDKMCHKSKNKEKLIKEYKKCIQDMAEMNIDHYEFYKDKIKDFGKRQAMVDAILESADIIQNNPNDMDKISEAIKRASSVGEDIDDLGTSIRDDIEETFQSFIEEEDVIERIPTGMKLLDATLKGGIGKTEMCVVVAPPGRGKTTFMISAGGHAFREGYKVLHISLENNAKQIKRNYILRTLEKDMDYVKTNMSKSIKAMLNRFKYDKISDIIIKKYPTKGCSVKDIEILLDQLIVTKGWHPDLLIVDYGQILRPSTNYTEKRNNQETIYEDLRGLADKYNVAILTAAQGNRGALSKKIVTMEDLAECFAIANTADVMVSLCQTLKEKESGIMRLFLAKVRDATDGICLQGKVDYACKKLEFDSVYDIDENDMEEGSQNSSYKSSKKTTKRKKKSDKDLDEEDDVEDNWE